MNKHRLTAKKRDEMMRSCSICGAQVNWKTRTCARGHFLRTFSEKDGGDRPVETVSSGSYRTLPTQNDGEE